MLLVSNPVARSSRHCTDRLSSTSSKALFSSSLIVKHFKNVLKAQNIECVFDLGDKAADFDVAADFPNLFDEAHENSQSGGRDVTQLFAVNDDAVATGGDLRLNCVLELWSRVGVHKTFERDD